MDRNIVELKEAGTRRQEGVAGCRSFRRLPVFSPANEREIKHGVGGVLAADEKRAVGVGRIADKICLIRAGDHIPHKVGGELGVNDASTRKGLDGNAALVKDGHDDSPVRQDLPDSAEVGLQAVFRDAERLSGGRHAQAVSRLIADRPAPLDGIQASFLKDDVPSFEDGLRAGEESLWTGRFLFFIVDGPGMALGIAEHSRDIGVDVELRGPAYRVGLDVRVAKHEPKAGRALLPAADGRKAAIPHEFVELKRSDIVKGRVAVSVSGECFQPLPLCGKSADGFLVRDGIQHQGEIVLDVIPGGVDWQSVVVGNGVLDSLVCNIVGRDAAGVIPSCRYAARPVLVVSKAVTAPEAQEETGGLHDTDPPLLNFEDDGTKRAENTQVGYLRSSLFHCL